MWRGAIVGHGGTGGARGKAVDEVNLTTTRYDDEWHALTVAMFVAWGAVLAWTCLVLWQGRKRRGRTDGSAASAQLLRQSVLSLNVCVCSLRLVLFVDPRGWEDTFDPVVYELLLRVAFCLMLAQWLLVILRWHDLDMFTGSKGLGLMVNWTPRRWKRTTLSVIGLLTTLITVFTAISEAGFSRDVLSDAANWVLGLYSGLFVVVGSYVGFRASRGLYKNVRGERVRKASAPSTPSPQRAVKIRHARQILVSLAIATPATVLLIAVSMWRGQQTLSPGEFLAYLAVRHSVEVVMCVTVLYAVHATLNVARLCPCMANRSRDSQQSAKGAAPQAAYPAPL